MQLQKELYSNTTANKYKWYWVGIKYQKNGDKFTWDNGKEVSQEESNELRKIVDLSSLNKHLNWHCVAIKNEKKLKPLLCGQALNYVCQTVTNGGWLQGGNI